MTKETFSTQAVAVKKLIIFSLFSYYSFEDTIMHLSIVSATVRRVGNPQEIDMVGCPWGRDLRDNCIPSLRKLTKVSGS